MITAKLTNEELKKIHDDLIVGTKVRWKQYSDSEFFEGEVRFHRRYPTIKVFARSFELLDNNKASSGWRIAYRGHVYEFEIIDAPQEQKTLEVSESDFLMNMYAATAILEQSTTNTEGKVTVTKTVVLPLDHEMSEEPLSEYTANYRLKAIKAAEEKKLTFKGVELKLYIKLDTNITAVN